MSEEPEPKYATGGIIRPGEVRPLDGENGCAYVVHDRNAKPSGIIRVPRKLSDEEFERFRAAWQAANEGANTAHKVTYLGDTRLPWWKRAYYRARRWLA